MKRAACILLVLLLSAPAFAELPERYGIVVQRSIFDPDRGPRPTVRPPEAPPYVAPEPPKPPPEKLTLVGVVIIDGQATALFASSSPELGGLRRPGERVVNLEVSAVTTKGVTLSPGESDEPIDLTVGGSLQRQPGETWQPSEERVAAPPPTVSSTSGSSAPSGGESQDEILKRMLERRKQENQ